MANRPRIEPETLERLKKLMDEIHYLKSYDAAVNYLLNEYNTNKEKRDMKVSEIEVKTEKRRLLKVEDQQIVGMAYCLGEVPIIELTFEGETRIAMLPPNYEIPKASDLVREGNEESEFKEDLEFIELTDQLIPNYREFIGKKLTVSFPSQGDPYVLELTAAR